jgi:hypothetical protein
MTRLITALHGNQHDTDQFIGVIAGTVPIPEFFAPGNIQRIIDTEDKPRMMDVRQSGSGPPHGSGF